MCSFLLVPLALNSLQGALGKTAGRSYKAAPRQLLQVDSSANGPGGSPTLSHATAHAHISKADATTHQDGAGVAAEAAKFGKQALGEVDVSPPRYSPHFCPHLEHR